MNWLIAEYAGIASNCELALGLRNHIQLNVVYERKDPYGLDYPELDIEFGSPPQKPFKPLAYNGELLIIISTPTLNRLIKHRSKDFFNNWNRKIIIISDGWYMYEYGSNKIMWKEFNELFNELGLEVWVTHDKLQFRKGLPTKDFYQPFDLSGFDLTKNNKLTISHSPFRERRKEVKGSLQIEATVKRLKVNYDEIVGLKWGECMKRKAKSHIFVDQIKSNKYIHNELGWIGGIGKSGFEAMLLKSLLICRGKFEGIDIPVPPVAWCKSNTFEKVLKYYINNEKERNELIEKQYQWAIKYLNRDFCAKRIINT